MLHGAHSLREMHTIQVEVSPFAFVCPSAMVAPHLFEAASNEVAELHDAVEAEVAVDAKLPHRGSENERNPVLLLPAGTAGDQLGRSWRNHCEEARTGQLLANPYLTALASLQ